MTDRQDHSLVLTAREVGQIRKWLRKAEKKSSDRTIDEQIRMTLLTLKKAERRALKKQDGCNGQSHSPEAQG